MIEINLNT